MIILVIALLTLNIVSAQVPDWAKGNKNDYLLFWDLLVKELAGLNVKKYKEHKAEGYIQILEDSEYFEKNTEIGAYNIFYNCLKYDRTGWNMIIDRQFAGLRDTKLLEKQIRGELEDYTKAVKYLYVRIFPAEYKKNLGTGYVGKEDFEGTLTVVVINYPAAVKNLDPHYPAVWNKTTDEIIKTALENTLKNTIKTLSRKDFIKDLPVYYMIDTNDIFVTANIYNLDSFAELESVMGCFVSLPCRTYFLAVPLKTKDTVNEIAMKFIQLTANVYSGEDGSITQNVYWYCRGKFYTVKRTGTGDKGSIRLPDELIRLME